MISNYFNSKNPKLYIYIYIWKQKKGILTSKSLNNCASAASCAHVENLTDSPHMLQSTGSHSVVDACHCPSESWPRGHTLQVVLFTGHCFLYSSLEDKDNLLNSFESLYDWRDQLGWCLSVDVYYWHELLLLKLHDLLRENNASSMPYLTYCLTTLTF